MLSVNLPDLGRPLQCLAVGAHCDDVEIGAGGTLLSLAALPAGLDLRVVVLTGDVERAAEARASAAAFSSPFPVRVEVHNLPDGHLPQHWSAVKTIIEATARRVSPDVILGPGPLDAHQDHRTVAEVLPTVFRNHWLWQYEIPKWDGDLGRSEPTLYVPLDESVAQRKCDLLREHFPSQYGRDWFNAETFLALARLRGMECRARYAEAFSVPKTRFDPFG